MIDNEIFQKYKIEARKIIDDDLFWNACIYGITKSQVNICIDRLALILMERDKGKI